MMEIKKIIFLCNLLAISEMVIAQNSLPSIGNIGIGTLSPESILHVKSDANTSGTPANSQLLISGETNPGKRLSIAYNTSSNYAEMQSQAYEGSYTPIILNPNGGNVGIGSLLPDSKLTLRDNNPFIDVQSSEDGQKTGLWMRYRNSAFAGTKLYYSTLDAVTYLDNLYPYQTGAPYGSFNIRSINDQGQLTSRLYVEGTSGNVGVGTTDSKGYRLAVNGKIRAQEIKVENTNWPDYVFTKSYQLPTLQETEKHIKEKGHLSGIPSAEEVKANGVDLGEMNAKLLRKIEELTLHLIEMKKDAEMQEKEVQLLKSSNQKIIAELEKRKSNNML